ncbi:hypothetical protein K490DRAFT_65135 [Saccharata proteae CBS 121410]|uniref:Uncharacterized protein n=1 Tax=Saccharata proteae CBS 121410 TaxID=1314787 RepID=A0A9P4LVU5_9PEZI|nr:hypothetical protein K490DRAFT_65135 [Saccharata proteae CBS 121410]
MSTNPSSTTGFDAIIDLTEDEPASMSDNSPAPDLPEQLPQQRAASTRQPRLPRFPREIIDLSDDTPQRRHRSPPYTAAVPIPESPDVEFVSARTIPGAPPAQPRQNLNHLAIDLTDDDIDILEVRVRAGGINGGTPGEGGFRTRTDRADQLQRARRMQEMHAARQRQPNEHPLRRPRFNPTNYLGQLAADVRYFGGAMREVLGGFIDYGERPPDLGIGRFGLDYDAAAFDLGYERDQPPPPPTYHAPSKAPEGFTRSPEEDEVLICPNCERELCSGSEDANKQVWIIKACGHAYCGECTINRHSSKRRGKEPARLLGSTLPPPFSKCAVQGCEKNTKSKTAMLQLFL